MLKEKLKSLFTSKGGIIKCSTLRRSNIITFKMTEDGLGFYCDRGPAVFKFETMDALEHEMKIVARYNNGKVYYGANAARGGTRVGDDGWFENTIEGIMARRCFNKEDGDSVFAASSYIAALLEKVGFAHMHSSDNRDAYVVLNN